jgi:hypothetical protein
MDFPIGPPLQVSVIFLNHTEPSLSFPSNFNITDCLSSSVIYGEEENIEEFKRWGKKYSIV